MSKQATSRGSALPLFPTALAVLLLSTTAYTDGHTVPERPCVFGKYVSYEVKRNMNYVSCLIDGVITVRVYR